jgi:hypothetical protein
MGAKTFLIDVCEEVGSWESRPMVWLTVSMMSLVAPLLIVAWLYGAPTTIDELPRQGLND